MDSSTALNYQPYFNATYYVGLTTNYSDISHDNEFFWSENATYCSSDDTACISCRAKWVGAFQNQSLHSNFSCVGAGGCVCTAYCELRQTASFPAANFSTGAESCYPRSSGGGADQQGLMMVRNITSLLIGAILVVAAVRQFMIQFHQST